MSGLLKRAMDIHLRLENSGADAAKYASTMEIEEFGENSPLKISPDVYGGSPVPPAPVSLLTEIENLEDNIELPSTLLDAFRRHFSFSGGALLFWDKEEKLYVPWASEGLDKTTARRLRFTDKFIKKEKKEPSKYYAEKDLEIFRPFFSVRLFDQLENLTLASLPAPKKQAENIPAILLMLNLKKEGDPSFLSLLDESLKAAEEVLSSSRLLRIAAVAGPEEVLDETELFRQIDGQIEKILHLDKKLTMIVLNLENILAYLDRNASHLDPFRVKQDVLAILESMLGGIGVIYNLKDKRIILLLSSKTAVKEELLINQIHLSLQSFFQHKDGFPPLEAKIKRIPEDGVDSASLLDDFA